MFPLYLHHTLAQKKNDSTANDDLKNRLFCVVFLKILFKFDIKNLNFESKKKKFQTYPK